MGADGQAIITDFEVAGPADGVPERADAPRRSVPDHAAVVGVLPWSTRSCSRRPGRSRRSPTAPTSTTAASGIDLVDTIRPVTHANVLGIPSAVTPAGVVRRSARRRAGDGRPVHRPAVSDGRRRDRVARRRADPDRPRHGLNRWPPKLVALDLPGGPEFVERLAADLGRRRRRVPGRPTAPDRGEASRCARRCGVGDEVERGDALVVATSGSTGDPEGRRADPRRRRRVGRGDEPAARRAPPTITGWPACRCPTSADCRSSPGRCTPAPD